MVSEIKDLEGKKLAAKTQHFTDMKKILTPDQFKKFVQIRKDKKGRRERKGHKRFWGRKGEREEG